MDFEVDTDNLRANSVAIEDARAGATADLVRLHGESEAGGNAPWGTGFLTNAVISGLYQELIWQAPLSTPTICRRTSSAKLKDELGEPA